MFVRRIATLLIGLGILFVRPLMAQKFENEMKRVDSVHINDSFYQECVEYVNLEPAKRLSYLENCTEGTTFMLARTDVTSLSNLDSLPRFDFDIVHDTWEVRLILQCLKLQHK